MCVCVTPMIDTRHVLTCDRVCHRRQTAAQMSTNKLTLSLLRESERKQLRLEHEVRGWTSLQSDPTVSLTRNCQLGCCCKHTEKNPMMLASSSGPASTDPDRRVFYGFASARARPL